MKINLHIKVINSLDLNMYKDKIKSGTIYTVHYVDGIVKEFEFLPKMKLGEINRHDKHRNYHIVFMDKSILFDNKLAFFQTLFDNNIKNQEIVVDVDLSRIIAYESEGIKKTRNIYTLNEISR